MSMDAPTTDLSLFMHAPPEHVAHVINAACLYVGLRRLGVTARWITMNPRDSAPTLYPREGLSRLGLEEFVPECNTEVINCAGWVQDEFRPEVSAIRRLIDRTQMRQLFLHYYPPLWGPVVEACRADGIRVGLHVQVFSRSPNDPPFFAKIEGALDAVRNADYITVSQESDVDLVCRLSSKNRSDIAVLPKSVPPCALARAREKTFSARDNGALHDIFSTQIPTVTYLGRLERFKNIDWFLKHCMPHLNERADEFRLLIVGRGTLQNEVVALARSFKNVRVVLQQLRYDQGLRLLSESDLVLFPSGYDYSPRLPLEAILLGKPVLMGQFAFNLRYHNAASYLVDSAGTARAVLEYSRLRIEYGVPDIEQAVGAIRCFLDTTHETTGDRSIDPTFARESDPMFGASRLLSVMRGNV